MFCLCPRHQIFNPLQLRSQSAIRMRLLQHAGLDGRGGNEAAVQPASALLILSGSHPARTFLQRHARLHLFDSFRALEMARTMRIQGQLPPSLELWAVENPLTTNPERLAAKVWSQPS